MPGPHLLCTAAVVLGSYRDAAVCSRQLDPKVSGRCMPNYVSNNLLDTSENCVRPQRVINRRFVDKTGVIRRRRNPRHKCSQRLSEPDWIFASQSADNISQVG